LATLDLPRSTFVEIECLAQYDSCQLADAIE
jgi:hypothetical protein